MNIIMIIFKRASIQLIKVSVCLEPDVTAIVHSMTRDKLVYLYILYEHLHMQ